MALWNPLRRWFERPPAGGASKPPRRTRAQVAEDDVLDLVFGGPPPAASTAEPAWVDPEEPGAAQRARPYLEMAEGELERHAREEDSLPGAPPSIPSPQGALDHVLGLVLRPWRALPENLRLVVAALAALFVVLGGFLPFLLDAVNAALTPMGGR